MLSILLVEDDKTIWEPLVRFLESENFKLYHAEGQTEAIELSEKQHFDLAIIDITLRDGNGYNLCARIKQKSGVPVIFLSAAGDEHSVVAGLEIGGDDYIIKPFRSMELVSRIRAVLRRNGQAGALLGAGDVTLDPDRAKVWKNGELKELTALEYRLLLYLLNHRGAVVTRAQLLESLWDIAGDYVNDNTLSVYIRRLREKLEDNPAEPGLIKTVRGLGYCIE